MLKAKSSFNVLKITNNFANIILLSTNEFCEHFHENDPKNVLASQKDHEVLSSKITKASNKQMRTFCTHSMSASVRSKLKLILLAH